MKTSANMKLTVLASMLIVLPFWTEAATCVGKTVVVWVVNGHDLTGDPFVKVTIGGDTKKTKTIYDEVYPVWYKKMQFKKASSDMMKIEVWEADGDDEDDDDLLGTCLAQLKAGNQWNKVVCTTNDEGNVKLFYKCQ